MKCAVLTALGAELVILGCAAPATNENLRYERVDAYERLAESYRAESRRCRQSGGVMVSPGSWRRTIGPRLTTEQMRGARCVTR